MRTELYTIDDVVENGWGETIEGKIVVLDPEALAEDYRKPEFQLVKARGGFGCRPDTIGTAVFVEFLADGDRGRFERYNVLGVLKEELLKELNN